MRNVVDYATLTVSNSAVDLGDASPAVTSLSVHPKWAMITVEDDQVRFRDDGENPTSSEGHLLNAGDVLLYMDGDESDHYAGFLRGNKLHFIRVSTDAKLKISYYC